MQDRQHSHLQQDKELFQALVNNSLDILAVCNPDNTFRYVNPAMQQVMGYTPEELIGTTVSDLVHPDDLVMADPDVDEVRNTSGRVGPIAMRYRHKDGTWRYLETIINNLIDDPNLRGVVCTTRDVTEYRRAEEVQRQRDLYQTLLNTQSDLGDGVIISENNRIVYTNEAFCQISGYSSQELLALPSFLDLTAPDQRSALMQRQLQRANGQTVPDHYETAILHKDGHRVELEVAVKLLQAGKNSQVIVVARNITGRKQSEEALRQSEERYRAVVEQAAESIFMVDPATGRILEANQTFQQLLGYTAEELLGMTLYDVVAHASDSIDANIQRILLNRHHRIGERQYRRKDGSVVDADISVSVVTQAGKDVMSIVAHDVSERKHYEEALKRSLDALIALHESGQILSSTLELEEIGNRLLHIMQRVSSLTAAAVSLRNEQGQLKVWRTIGPEDLLDPVRCTPEARTIRSEVLKTEELRLFQLHGAGSSPSLTVGLCLPLRMRNQVIGVLEAYGPESLAEKHTLEILGSLTNQAASALENARLYRELAEREKRLQDLVGKLIVAQEKERHRVAYEVHDGLAQVAAAAHQHLQAFARYHPPYSAQGNNKLSQALELVQQTVKEARRVIANLRPTALDDFGVAAAIRLQIETLRKEDWEITYEDALGDSSLPAPVETALFRIAQEALTNVRKHSGSKRAYVALQSTGLTVRLKVQDWGRGIDPNVLTNGSGPGERVGLSGMRERVALLGGEFRVSSQPGSGTVIVAEVPIPVEEDTGLGE